MFKTFDCILVAFLAATCLSINLKTNKSLNKSKLSPAPSVIHITVDNTLTSIKVNGEEVDLEAPNAADWTKADTFIIPYFEGDSIEITGINTGGPNAMIATIQYSKFIPPQTNDPQDMGSFEVKYISTNKDTWECDNGTKSYGNLGDDVWANRVSGAEGIRSDAEWIWGPGQAVNKPMTCRFPKSVQEEEC